MSIIEQISYLQSDKRDIAAAIAAKGGTVLEGDGFDTFPYCIATIPAEEQEYQWERPTAWGQYPSEFTAEKALPDASRTMEAIYILYNNKNIYGDSALFAGFKCGMSSGQYTVERGHMSNTTFVVDATSTVNSNSFYTEDFTSQMGQFILYRITPATSGATFTSFSFGHTDTYLNTVNQVILECYGRTKMSVANVIKNPNLIHFGMLTYGASSANQIFSGCYSLEYAELNTWDMSLIVNLSYIFSNCVSLKQVDCGEWDTSSITSLKDTFKGCSSLIRVDLNNWDVSNVTDLSYMFSGCKALKSININSWETSSVVQLDHMFDGCYSLRAINLDGWDLSLATNFSYMFSGCYSLSECGCEFLAESMQNLSYMFNNCHSLREIDCQSWDVSNVTTISNIFYNCYSLISVGVAYWNTSSLLTADYAFYSCYSLKELSLNYWDLSKITNMKSMFSYCETLGGLNLSDYMEATASAITNMNSMFTYCYCLKYLNLANWDISNLTNVGSLFSSTKSLISLDMTGWDNSTLSYSGMSWPSTLKDFIPPKFYTSVSFNTVNNLSHDSLLAIINNLATVSTAQTLRLGATNYNKMSAAEIAIATGKGWTVQST